MSRAHGRAGAQSRSWSGTARLPAQAMWTIVLASGLVLMGCVGLNKKLFGGTGKDELQAVRFPATPQNRHCEARCSNDSDGCAMREDLEGAPDSSDLCLRGYMNCVAECDGATSLTTANQKVTGDAGKWVCNEGLPAGAKMDCVVAVISVDGKYWPGGHSKDYLAAPSKPAAAATSASTPTSTSAPPPPKTMPGKSGSARTGEQVLARFRNGKYWFAGVVTGTDGKTVQVAYYDGMTERVPASRVRPFDWTVGSKVSCNWKRRNEWFPGTIASINGGSVHIRYDDGDAENTMIAFCRAGH